MSARGIRKRRHVAVRRLAKTWGVSVSRLLRIKRIFRRRGSV